MEAKPNPIYLQLTHRTRAPANGAPKRLTLILTGACSLLMGAAIVYVVANPTSSALIYIPILSMMSFALIAPAIALMIATLLVSRHAGQEHLMLVQLSGLHSIQIVQGYIDAVNYHLRFLRAVAIAFGITGLITIPLLYNSYLINCFYRGEFYCSFTDAVGMFILGSIMAFVVIVILAVLGVFISELAIHLGVWVGITWHGNAVAVAASILGIGLLALVGLLALFVLDEVLGICSSMGVFMLIVFASPPLVCFFRRRAQQSIERAQITAGSP